MRDGLVIALRVGRARKPRQVQSCARTASRLKCCSSVSGELRDAHDGKALGPHMAGIVVSRLSSIIGVGRARLAIDGVGGAE